MAARLGRFSASCWHGRRPIRRSVDQRGLCVDQWAAPGALIRTPAGPGLAPSEQLACRLAPPEASSNRLNACAERNPHATHDELEPIKALIKIAEGVERLGAAVLDAVGANVFETL